MPGRKGLGITIIGDLKWDARIATSVAKGKRLLKS